MQPVILINPFEVPTPSSKPLLQGDCSHSGEAQPFSMGNMLKLVPHWGFGPDSELNRLAFGCRAHRPPLYKRQTQDRCKNYHQQRVI